MSHRLQNIHLNMSKSHHGSLTQQYQVNSSKKRKQLPLNLKYLNKLDQSRTSLHEENPYEALNDATQSGSCGFKSQRNSAGKFAALGQGLKGTEKAHLTVAQPPYESLQLRIEDDSLDDIVEMNDQSLEQTDTSQMQVNQTQENIDESIEILEDITGANKDVNQSNILSNLERVGTKGPKSSLNLINQDAIGVSSTEKLGRDILNPKSARIYMEDGAAQRQ